MTHEAVLALTKTSTGEAVQFWFLAIIAVAGALGMVLSKKAVHSALSLCATMICLAICYLAQGAVFLGIVQIVVYTGAIMMLFLFVLMLVGVDSSDSLVETIKGQRWAALLSGLGFGVLLVGGVARARIGKDPRPGEGVGYVGAPAGSNVKNLAYDIFSTYFWAFEVTSALLIVAAMGAMVLAHRERTTERRTQRELAEERIRANRYVAPLPAPGVYARHNAVDTPALLPDGSISELSVNRTLAGRGEVRRVLHGEPEGTGDYSELEALESAAKGADE